MRPVKNYPFCPISVSGEKFNPRNTTCIPPVEFFAFLELEQKGALDAVGKVLISKGDKIGMASPTYLGAIQAFDPYEPDSGSKQQCCGHGMPSQKDDNPRQISTGYYHNNCFNRYFPIYFSIIQLKQWTGPVPRTTGDQSHKSYYWKLFFMPKRNSRKPMDSKNWP